MKESQLVLAVLLGLEQSGPKNGHSFTTKLHVAGSDTVSRTSKLAI